MTTKKAKETEKSAAFTVPMMADDSACNMGEIKINYSVIANIATLSAMQTEGVLAVGKNGLARGIAAFFSKKKSTSGGVNVSEDEFGNYVIDIWVILKFGCELAKVAANIQQNVTENITKMATTSVSKVNVVIDGVEISDESERK
jgi:uncharacterized alkaline shock family protein YloU